jgi:hypothetical protein
VTVDALWLASAQEVVSRGAHEVKDVLNGVCLNVEVVRSRAARPGVEISMLAPFATAAADQLEVLTARVEALLFIARPARNPADVALTLKHLAALLVPASRADGGALTVEGLGRPAPTSAGGQAVRLALAAGLLGLMKDGGTSRCVLESGPAPVVRFSHESAGARSLDAAIASAIAEEKVKIDGSGPDLLLVFPGS